MPDFCPTFKNDQTFLKKRPILLSFSVNKFNCRQNHLKDPTGVSGFGDMECPKPNPWILSLFIPIFVLFSMKIVLKI